VVQQLAHWEGCLILAGRSRGRLEDARKTVEALGGKASIFAGDLSEPSMVQELIDASEAQHPIYGVIMSAGIGTYGNITDQSVQEWSHQIDVNLIGPYHLTHAAMQCMVPRGEGHFIFINSVAGLESFPGNSAYVAAKHGLRGFAEALRMEAREHQIKVTSIFPGATDTEWWDKQAGEFPRDRMLKAEDVAAAVEFALSFTGNGVVEELTLRHLGGNF
jgi:short-subunit dehydrogenase